MPAQILSHTLALCPVCRQEAPARILDDAGSVWLERWCPEHGSARVPVCSDPDWYRRGLDYVKPAQPPRSRSVVEYRGCPQSCGLCPEHGQHSCMPILEITGACNLACPICLKDAAAMPEWTLADVRRVLAALSQCEGAVPVLNLSGGEPTLHPHFRRVVRLAYAAGVAQVTVSTNGLELLRRPSLRAFFKETGTIAALQFDGFDAENCRRLRGLDLVPARLELLDRLAQEGVPHSLVATVVPGVNDDEIPAITDLLFASPALSLMFQPAAFSGRAAAWPGPRRRITVPDLLRQIGRSLHARPDHFTPLPCSHPSCFALAYYLSVGSGEFVPLSDLLGPRDYLAAIANRTLPGLDRASFERFRQKTYELWSAADASDSSQRILKRLRQVLRELSAMEFSPRRAFALGAAHLKAVFIHSFMDAETLDFGRLLKCCNHYPQPDGRLVPCCAQNVLTAAVGSAALGRTPAQQT